MLFPAMLIFSNASSSSNLILSSRYCPMTSSRPYVARALRLFYHWRPMYSDALGMNSQHTCHVDAQIYNHWFYYTSLFYKLRHMSCLENAWILIVSLNVEIVDATRLWVTVTR